MSEADYLAIAGIAFMVSVFAYALWPAVIAKLPTGPVQTLEWRWAEEEKPEDEERNKQVLTYWSDGTLEIVEYEAFPQFWEGQSVSDAVMLKWAYVDAPGVSDG